MRIIEYEEQYREAAQDLLVELEDHLVSLDQDHLEQVGADYREKMLQYDLADAKASDGMAYLAIEGDRVIGLIIGVIRVYDERDHLDFKCPPMGKITELVISKEYRGGGVGSLLLAQMEQFFRQKGCEYIAVDAFAYNSNALRFYEKNGFHPRLISMLKPIEN